MAGLTLAIGVTMTVESVVEIAEYPVLYSGSLDATAYYDTIADIASTLVGAAIGALGSVAIGGRIPARWRANERGRRRVQENGGD